MNLKSIIKRELHRRFDPIIARRNNDQWQSELQTLSDGTYTLSFEVPYYPQFTSPDLINDYIHHDFIGLQDPRWREFGTESPEEYAFWAPRVCAIACLKMAMDAYHVANPSPSIWQLVQDGIAAGGYKIYDERGNWADVGWYVTAQMQVAEQYGLRMTGHPYGDVLGICASIQQDKLVAATVSPEIGERNPKTDRYGGHLILITGFKWSHGKPTAFRMHNPSGRYPELQSGAWIDIDTFKALYAYRFSTYEVI